MPPLRSNLDVWVQLDMGCHVVVPVNCELKNNGALVMGAGLAKAMADAHPTLDRAFGIVFSMKGPGVHRLDCSRDDGKNLSSLISFPTKVRWRERADLRLFVRSLRSLVSLVDSEKLTGIYVPKVGCGLGGMDWRDVSYMFEKTLDDRFIVPPKPEGNR